MLPEALQEHRTRNTGIIKTLRWLICPPKRHTVHGASKLKRGTRSGGRNVSTVVGTLLLAGAEIIAVRTSNLRTYVCTFCGGIAPSVPVDIKLLLGVH